jgi:YD repeat-containing protein
MTVASQPAVTYTYDNMNRLTTITQGTNVVTLAYDDADRRTSVTYPNGNGLTYTYDAASQLTAITYKQGVTTIGDLSYTYDAAGNRIKQGGAFARSTIPQPRQGGQVLQSHSCASMAVGYALLACSSWSDHLTPAMRSLEKPVEPATGSSAREIG